MSNGISSSSSFSAELLLNKIMNGQVETNNGKTVSLGTRSTASKLDREAREYGVSATNLEGHVASANATQAAVTGIQTQLSGLIKALDSNNIVGSATAATGISEVLGKLLETEVDGQAVLGDGTVSVSNGLGATIELGNLEMDATGTEYQKLDAMFTKLATDAAALATTSAATVTAQATFDAITGTPTSDQINALALAKTNEATAKTTAAASLGALKGGATNALDEVIGVAGKVGSQVSAISNSRDILQNLSVDTGIASDNQTVAGSGSTSRLLNNLLG